MSYNALDMRTMAAAHSANTFATVINRVSYVLTSSLSCLSSNARLLLKTGTTELQQMGMTPPPFQPNCPSGIHPARNTCLNCCMVYHHLLGYFVVSEQLSGQLSWIASA